MKLAWQGTLLAIQPRIRLTRSFDERSHTYLGYALRLDGAIGERRGGFLVGIGSGTQAKHRFRAGDIVQGESIPVADSRTEPVDFYKTVRLKLVARGLAGQRRRRRPLLPGWGFHPSCRSTGNGAIGGSTRGPTSPDAARASGAAGCRWT
jgi:hypothetical protein